MRRILVSLGLVLMLWPVAALAQSISSLNVIPVVAHTSGAGDPPTQWVSDVTIHNPNDFPVTVAMAFAAEGVANQFEQVTPILVQVPASRTIAMEDILASLFNITTNLKGALLIDAGYLYPLGNPEGAGVLVTSRTYNTGSPSGTFGQTVSSASLFINFTGLPSVVTGTRLDARYRSNLGILSISPEEVMVHWSAIAADGQVIASGSKTMPQFTMIQWSFSELGIPTQSGPITLRLWLDESDVTADPCAELFANGFVAYVSKVDGNPEGTGDAELLFAIPTSVPSCWLDELF